MARIHQMTIPEFEKAFPNEEACQAYLVRHRWPNAEIVCPRCGKSEKVSAVSTMPFKWQCYSCSPDSGYRFSVIAGTIFENTNKPLREWFRVIHTMMTSKKGVSALQIQRVMGFGSYRTAWYMCHRVRAGLADEKFRQLMGIVEVDETFIGGKWHSKHKSVRAKTPGNTIRGSVQKAIVAGAVERGGNVVARVVAATTREALSAFIAEAVSNRVSLICTDQWGAYTHLDPRRHRTVDHSKGQYVVGAIHTQTIEGFWSILKRGMVGTFHKVGAKYLPLYVAEFAFRYNNRLNDDIFGAAISAC
jgi:transposase-like protein/IS1 family transposase